MTTRTRALMGGMYAFFLVAPLCAAPPDMLIRGGTIYTGTDAPFVGDVAVTGDHISAVGRHLAVTARRVIDAKGMIVAPGFIDPHTHVGEDLLSGDAHRRLVPAFLMQGVTTALIGNDGLYTGRANVNAEKHALSHPLQFRNPTQW